MKRIFLACLLAIAAGCGATTATEDRGTTAAEVDRAHEAAVAELLEGQRSQERELRELRSRLALAEAEARSLAADERERELTSVRIGGDRPAEDEEEGWITPDDDGWISEEGQPTEVPAADGSPEDFDVTPEDDGPRPVLRLYGTPPSEPSAALGQIPSSTTPRAPLAPVPQVSERLPVSTAVRGLGAGVPALPAAPLPTAAPAAGRATPAAAPGEAAAADYRAALAHVRDRNFDEALRSLSRFVERHPRHPYTDNALYWRGEVYYIRRQYPQALAEFARLLAQHPNGNKAADALLKLGMCHMRMGDTSRAEASFRRLRSQYPNSVAARQAQRENAS